MVDLVSDPGQGRSEIPIGGKGSSSLVVAEQRYLKLALQGGALKRSTSPYPEVELALLRAIAPLIPEKTAIDVGAFEGEYTTLMRQLGFSVVAFEPLPELALALTTKFKLDDGVKVIASAVGDEDGIATLLLAETNPALAPDADPRLFSSLVLHRGDGLLAFNSSIATPVRRLRTLIEARHIPAEIGILKVDTEGQDIGVLVGAWPHLGRITLCEYWNDTYSLSDHATPNNVNHYNEFLKAKGYFRTITIGRDLVGQRMVFQVDAVKTVPRSYGNIIITRDERVFSAALGWCLDVFGPDGLHI